MPMAINIAARKKARAQRKTSLRQKAQESQSKTNYNDDRMWSCETDSTKKGEAVIRFLPPTETLVKWYMEKFDCDEFDVPFYINYHEHGFKGVNGKWYIEKCPTSIVDRECPVCEANGVLVDGEGGWDAMDDDHPTKKLVRGRKRKSRYIANILIVKDSANPDNEGQVKIFQYGKAIHDQVMAQLVPEFEDEVECDVSDEIEGRDFKLKITQKDGYANYDKSSWVAAAPIGGLSEDDEDAMQEILDKCHDLTDIVAETKYKSYDDLNKQFDKTKGKTSKRASVEDDGGDDSGDGGDEPEAQEPTKRERKAAPAKKPEPKKEAPAKKVESKPADDGDDDAYFASLLDED